MQPNNDVFLIVSSFLVLPLIFDAHSHQELSPSQGVDLYKRVLVALLLAVDNDLKLMIAERGCVGTSRVIDPPFRKALRKLLFKRFGRFLATKLNDQDGAAALCLLYKHLIHNLVLKAV